MLLKPVDMPNLTASLKLSKTQSLAEWEFVLEGGRNARLAKSVKVYKTVGIAHSEYVGQSFRNFPTC